MASKNRRHETVYCKIVPFQGIANYGGGECTPSAVLFSRIHFLAALLLYRLFNEATLSYSFYLNSDSLLGI